MTDSDMDQYLATVQVRCFWTCCFSRTVENGVATHLAPLPRDPWTTGERLWGLYKGEGFPGHFFFPSLFV